MKSKVQRLKLKGFFKKEEFTSQTRTLLQSIDSMDEEVIDIITEYCSSWFTSYFEGSVEESDFLAEINKLEKPEAEQKLFDLIANEIKSLENQLEAQQSTSGESDKATTQNTKPQNIHDRIKPKTQTQTANTQNTTQQTDGKRRIVKIIQKDQDKLKKATQALAKSSSSASSSATANEDERLLNDLQDKKKQQRCRYFPSCKNEKTCEFIHPTEPCSFFPTCRFGNQCLNKHPDCKFGKNCTRNDCFYEHPFPKQQTVDPLIQMLTLINGGSNKRNLLALGLGLGTRLPTKRHFNPNHTKTPAAATTVVTTKTIETTTTTAETVPTNTVIEPSSNPKPEIQSKEEDKPADQQ